MYFRKISLVDTLGTDQVGAKPAVTTVPRRNSDALKHGSGRWGTVRWALWGSFGRGN